MALRRSVLRREGGRQAAARAGAVVTGLATESPLLLAPAPRDARVAPAPYAERYQTSGPRHAWAPQNMGETGLLHGARRPGLAKARIGALLTLGLRQIA